MRERKIRSTRRIIRLIGQKNVRDAKNEVKWSKIALNLIRKILILV